MTHQRCLTCGTTFTGYCWYCKAQLDAQAAAARLQIETHKRIALEQEEYERTEKKKKELYKKIEMERKLADHINSLPNIVEKLVTNTTNNQIPIKSLATITEHLSIVDEDKWIWLEERNQPKASVTYNRLHTLLSSKMAEWWEIRDTYSPSTVLIFKIIAKRLLYKDLESIRIAHKTLPSELHKLQEELGKASSLRDKVAASIETCKKKITELQKAITDSEEKLKVATEEQQKPIDTDEISSQARNRLTSIGLLGKIALFFFAEPKSAIDNASTSLTKSKEALLDTDTQLRSKQGELVLIEREIVGLTERINALPNEMLKGRSNPFFQSVLDP